MDDWIGTAEGAEHSAGRRSGPEADYRTAVSAFILVVSAIGVIVLLGWTFQIEAMKRIAPGLTSMNPVTAICFDLSALTLWLRRQGRPVGIAGLVVAILPLGILFVGITKLVDLAFGTVLCPDAALFTSQLDYGQAYPSRMAPNVAACFILLAAALLALDRPGWPRFLHPQWLMTPILAVALVALMGYAYDTSGFYKFKQYIPMALHSAVCFVFCALALILCRPDEAYMALIPRGSPGARSYGRMLPACILLPVVLGGFALLGTDNGWLVGRGTGTSIVAVLTILGMSVLAFLNSVALNRTETMRRAAEVQLQNFVAELDRRNHELEREVAERKRAEERASHQATHDALTGLPNRILFLDRLEKAIGRAIRHGDVFALFYIDIDKFKPVNDLYGHQAGDELLKELARRLHATVRKVDTMARIGGDEFAAIMDAPVQQQDAVQLAERITTEVSRPCRLIVPGEAQPIEVEVGVSLGIALFPGHADDLDTLVKVADGAMYRAKIAGKTLGRSTNIALANQGA